jgi:hypothetical protein
VTLTRVPRPPSPSAISTDEVADVGAVGAAEALGDEALELAACVRGSGSSCGAIVDTAH